MRRFKDWLGVAIGCAILSSVVSWDADSGGAKVIKFGLADTLALQDDPLATSFADLDSRDCDRVAIGGYFIGDSVRYAVWYGIKGPGGPTINWVAKESTLVNAAVASGAKLWVFQELVHDAVSGSNHTVHFDGFSYPRIRLRVVNVDTTDVASSMEWFLICGD